MFHRAASADAPGGDSEAGKPPILIRKTAPHETTQRDGCRDRQVKADCLEQLGDSPTRSTGFWPSLCKNAKKGEGSLGVMIATYCLEQDPVEEGFTPCLGVDSSTQKVVLPSATQVHPSKS